MTNALIFNTLFDTEKKVESLKISSDTTSPYYIRAKHLDLHQIAGFDYDGTDYNYWPSIQPFSTTSRVSGLTKESPHWQDWNGTVFVDVDLKHIPSEELDYPISELILSGCLHRLQDDINLLAAQTSRSGGLHFIFYFDVDKSSDSFRKVATIAQKRVISALQRFPKISRYISQYDATHKNKIIDDCTQRPAQPLRMSGSDLHQGNHINDEGFGFFDMSKVDEMLSKKEIRQTEENYDNGLGTNLQWNTRNAHFTGDFAFIEWNELNCFSLATFLANIGTDYATAHEIFFDMFSSGFPGRKSSWKTIEKEFNQAWNRAANYDIKHCPRKIIDFVQNSLGILHYEKGADSDTTPQQFLDQFLLDHAQHAYQYIPFSPDKTLTLTSNEYIGNYADRIEQMMRNADTNQIYVKAPCGSGKTKYIIEAFKKTRKAIIVVHLNSIKTSNYEEFLNKDGFDFDVPSNKELASTLANGRKLHSHLLLGWPQFAELLSRRPSLADYQIFIDEAHAFQQEIEYRHENIETIITNMHKVEGLRLFSATPCAEHSILMTDSNALRVEIEKDRPYGIDVYLVQNDNEDKSGKTPDTIAAYIRQAYADTSKVFAVLDNRHHKDYDDLLGDLSYIRVAKEESKSKDVRKVMKSQLMSQRVLVSTAFGKEGVEYQDDIDTLEVMIPQYADTTFPDVEQFMNRFRHKRHVSLFFWETNGLEDRLDYELLRKGRNLMSAEAAADERMPVLLENEGYNKNIMEVTKIPLQDIVPSESERRNGEDRHEGFRRLLSYRTDDILDRNVRNRKNVLREFRIIKPLGSYYHNEGKGRGNVYKDIQRVLSQKDNVDRYVGLKGEGALRGLIGEMIKDGLICGGNKKEGLKSGIGGMNGGIDFDDMDAVGALFNTSVDSCAVGGKKVSGKAKEGDKNEGKEFELTRDERKKVAEMTDEIYRLKRVVSMVRKGKVVEYDEIVSVDTREWCYAELWNRTGFVNWQIAEKFAEIYMGDDRDRDGNMPSGVSGAQKREGIRKGEWLDRELSELQYRGEDMTRESLFTWIDWNKVVRIGGRNVERKKGGRVGKAVGQAVGKAVHEKYCLVDNVDVRFSSVEDMWEYAKKEMGYKGELKSFAYNWKRLNKFRRI